MGVSGRLPPSGTTNTHDSSLTLGGVTGINLSGALAGAEVTFGDLLKLTDPIFGQRLYISDLESPRSCVIL